jgi:hypothetical protein
MSTTFPMTTTGFVWHELYVFCFLAIYFSPLRIELLTLFSLLIRYAWHTACSSVGVLKGDVSTNLGNPLPFGGHHSKSATLSAISDTPLLILSN